MEPVKKSNRYDMSTIGHWIDLAVMRKVKQLDLDFHVIMDDDWNDIVMLPRCLVDCDSLEVLKLKLFGCSLSLESFTGSKTLKIFELDNVNLRDRDLVHSFLVNCPLLEELSLIDCSTHNLDYLDISCPNLKTPRINNRGLDYYIGESFCERLNIICPKLVYLEYRGYVANHFSFDVQSLKKAVIELEDLGDIAVLDDNFDVTLRELFAQVSHVEYLSIHCHSIKSIAFNNFPEEVFPSFPNLKTLEITLFCRYMDDLVCLLKCSPNLKSLHMIIIDVGITPEEVETFIDEFDEVERRTLTCVHLKRVEFPKFSGEKELLAIARFLLEHGNALEEMVFGWSNKDKYHTQSMDTMNEVSNFYKASLSVKVITLLKIDTSDSSETDTSCSSESDTSF
ncbi:F-box domain, FBD domain, Leucine-rich repeat domain, L domain-like protein [Artemisia annua]|uniref:F-box domain, FBD domain, Leucine-rich repeat domain, L domain-like protein n=1 Tax=Artemisia annua TaxID=35608 RepID=A0A2U1MDQ8_ARTAN|nr:F-box domain, FBD domain, Leucine-rich repeat domain, L domain-like protein [Artemisia annua]